MEQTFQFDIHLEGKGVSIQEALQKALQDALYNVKNNDINLHDEELIDSIIILCRKLDL